MKDIEKKKQLKFSTVPNEIGFRPEYSGIF